jgi:protein SCO1/2
MTATSRTLGMALALAVFLLLCPIRAGAQPGMGIGYTAAPAPTPGLSNPPILRDVGIDQKLGAQIPLDTVFSDEAGNPVRLRDVIGKRPVILTLVYFNCPSLCTLVLNDLLRSLNSLDITAGRDFDVLTVSFDPHEGPDLARQKKAGYLTRYGRPGADAGWHFLTGSDESIHALTDSVGFRYAWDASSGTYAHASGIMILTPQGVVSKYIYGIDYAPEDLRSGLRAAGQSMVGPPTEVIILYCFHYDPATGQVGLIVTRALRVGGVLTILAMGGFITLALRRERHHRAVPPANDGPRSPTNVQPR